MNTHTDSTQRDRDAATLVRMAGAHAAGEAAARLRHSGMKPPGAEYVESAGAFQWAEATGYADNGIKSVFTQAFIAELARLRSAKG